MAYNRKQRLNDNIKAIETAFILDRELRTPTARERLLLERYCGFGGLKCILNPARELADAVHWAKSDLELFAPTVELHRLIRENSKNESEYKQLMDSLKQSVLTAFYTPSAVTEALADVLKEHQIIPERCLNPRQASVPLSIPSWITIPRQTLWHLKRPAYGKDTPPSAPGAESAHRGIREDRKAFQ